MKNYFSSHSGKSPLNRRGFSLIELMVAMTLGLIVVGAVGYLYLGSSRSFQVQDNLSRIQENTRYSVEVLSKDIRMAGYMGCQNLASITPAIMANNPPLLNFANALRGYEGGSGWTNPSSITAVSGADVVKIIRADGAGISLTGNMGTLNANIQINGNPSWFVAGQALLISDCQNADLFRATNVSSGTGTITIAHSESQNSSNNLSTLYGTNADVFAIEDTTYFIGLNGAGNPSLYRIPVSGTAEELVENVQDMQIIYGVDSGSDNAADSYVAASAVTDWRKVVSVRISLLFRSQDNNVTSQPQTYIFNGTTVTPGATDRRLRQAVTSTIAVRNRLP